MSTQARVTSLDALGRFRASLIVFANRSHSAVDQVTDELRRVRSWIQQEQRRRWEGEVQRRARVLAQAEQELLSAKLVKLLDNLNVQQAAVRKAKHALEEAEGKLRHVKRWSRDFDSATEALAKNLDSFRSVLVHDLPKGMAYLSEAQKALESYGELRAADPGPKAAAPGEPAELPPPHERQRRRKPPLAGAEEPLRRVAGNARPLARPQGAGV